MNAVSPLAETEPPPPDGQASPPDAARSIQPTGDRVLVRPAPHVRHVGLVKLVGGDRLDVVVSQVVARGPEVRARPWELAIGDFVLHVRVVGVRYDGAVGQPLKGGGLLFLKEDELLAVVSPEAADRITGQHVPGKDGLTDLRHG